MRYIRSITIHKEGRKTLFVLLIALLLFNGLIVYVFFPDTVMVREGIALFSAFFFLLVLQFFRSPVFQVDQNENQILAPADGRVVVVEEVEETEYLQGRRVQVSIFMSPFNVHVNRSPVEGLVSYCKYHAGRYLVAWHPKSSMANEHTSIAIKMKDGKEILLRQIAGAVARRIRYYVSMGQEVEQGQEFGFIKFGSRVDIFLPPGTDLKIRVGQKTVAGKTILGEF